MKKNIYLALFLFVFSPVTSNAIGFRLQGLLKYNSQTKAIKFKDNEMKKLYSHLNSIKVDGASLSKFQIKCMPEMIQLKARAGYSNKVSYTFIDTHESRTIASGPVKSGLKIKRELFKDKEILRVKDFYLYRTNPDNKELSNELRGSRVLKAALSKCCQSEFACSQYLDSRQ